jgi:hypothetical protein
MMNDEAELPDYMRRNCAQWDSLVAEYAEP